MPIINVVNRAGALQQIEVKSGSTLMEVLRDRGLDIEAICGGCCSCATCHVYIDESWSTRLGEKDEDEIELIEDMETFKSGRSRLSCMITITDEMDGLKLDIAPEE
jgi:2Fe-2S ferredoxin